MLSRLNSEPVPTNSVPDRATLSDFKCRADLKRSLGGLSAHRTCVQNPQRLPEANACALTPAAGGGAWRLTGHAACRSLVPPSSGIRRGRHGAVQAQVPSVRAGVRGRALPPEPGRPRAGRAGPRHDRPGARGLRRRRLLRGLCSPIPQCLHWSRATAMPEGFLPARVVSSSFHHLFGEQRPPLPVLLQHITRGRYHQNLSEVPDPVQQETAADLVAELH